MTDQVMLQEALEAIKAGQRARARDLFTRLLRADQNNADLWVYMSTVVDSDKELRYCLESALKIDPENQAARRGLILMGALPPDTSIKPVKPNSQRDWEIEEIHGAPGSDGKERKKLPLGRMVGLGLVGVVALGLIIFGITRAGRNNNEAVFVNTGPTSTPRPLFANTPTYTPEGGVAPTAEGGASTPVVNGRTPLASLLQATYTPTPLFVVVDHPSEESWRSAMTAFERGNWEQAVAFLDQFIQNNPEFADARYYRGLALLEMGDNLGAKDSFNKAVNVDPDFGPAYHGRALADLALNPNAAVAEDLNKAIELSPDFVDAYLTRAQYRLDRKNAEGAYDDALLAVSLAPESALAYYQLAEASFALEDYAGALEAAQTANNLDFTLLDNYYILGAALVEDGQLAEAIGPLQTYLTFYPENANGWYLLGRAQQSVGLHENAILIFDRVLELDANLYEANYYQAISYTALGEYEEADRKLQNTIRVFPNWFEAKLAIGINTFLSGDAGNGYLAINATANMAETDEQLAALYYWRALSLDVLEEYEVAQRDWNLLLELPAEVVPEEWAATAEAHLAGNFSTPTATAAIENPNETPQPSSTP